MKEYRFCEDCIFACKFDAQLLDLSCELFDFPKSIYTCEACNDTGCLYGGPYKKSSIRNTLRTMISSKYNIPFYKGDDDE